jgi:hypothetical protein
LTAAVTLNTETALATRKEINNRIQKWLKNAKPRSERKEARRIAKQQNNN